MIKKLLSVAVLALAINFLLVGGVAGWLVVSKHIDKERFAAVKAILFPLPPPPKVDQPTTQPDPTTQPSARMEALLAQANGRPAGEQVQFIQRSFDQQMAELDRRARELDDARAQIDLARQQELRDREKLDRQQKALDGRQKEADRLAGDKGFQDSLELYSSMPAKQAKSVFMTLPDAVVQQYLQAMPPKTATKIIKEFKLPDETDRIQKVMERMRQSNAAAPGTASPGAPEPQASLKE